MTGEGFDPGEIDRGTVVWCLVPFESDGESDGEGAGRPVVVANTAAHPFDGEQYIGFSLTTRTWYADRLIEVTETDWLDGGTPDRSYVNPWSVLSPQPDDIRFRVGRPAPTVLSDTLRALLPYLHPEPEKLV